MLKHYLTLQQKKLDQLGQQVHSQHQRLKQEETRQSQLEHYLDTLAQGVDMNNALIRQNCYGMQQHLHQLISSQQELVSQENTALQQCQAVFRQHYSKVKGLEQLQTRRQEHKEQQEERKLSRTLDDLSSFRFNINK